MDSAVFNNKSLQNFYLTFITYKKSDLPNGPEYLHYTINVSKSLSLCIANYLVQCVAYSSTSPDFILINKYIFCSLELVQNQESQGKLVFSEYHQEIK